jgi:sugar lactone lactonase YvrE
MLATLVTAALAGWVLWPAPIDPVAYRPPVKPALIGALAPNDALTRARLLGHRQLHGPEDVAVDAAGRVYCGTANGRILRLASEDAMPESFAVTAGRPLGLRFGAGGALIVCDAPSGLLSVDAQGQITLLTAASEDGPIRLADGLDVASDGTIYFSDASRRHGVEAALYDVLEARPSGRLLRYDPATRRTTTLLRDLCFANGVALSRNEDFVLVNETNCYRITRYWLKGPRAGSSDVFADNLPGFPDGVTSNGSGTFWLALFTVRNDLLDQRLHPHPWAKALLAKLPRALWPKPQPYGFVVAMDEEGRMVRSLQDPGGSHVRQVTTAREFGGTLYLGTLEDDWIAALPVGRSGGS